VYFLYIDIRYFAVTDLIDKKEVVLEFTKSEEMLADYFTKPLQGRLFLSMREKIVCGVPKERSAETGEAKIRKPENPKN